uniref:Phosphate transporter n=1 Tax=Ciona savignyi TaxID=51511 RepID=H2ZN43_CIOSA
YLWMLIVGFIAAFALSFSVGANDVANSFGTTIGSNVLTIKQACILATIFETAGALMVGAKVGETIRTGIIDVNLYSFEGGAQILMIGQVSAMFGSSIWQLLATFLKMPVSGTHSIVGACIGFSLVAVGANGVNWTNLGLIVASWFVSPVLAGFASVLLYYFIHKHILQTDEPLAVGLKLLPMFYSVTVGINLFSILYSGAPVLGLDNIPLWVIIVSTFGGMLFIAAVTLFFIVPRIKQQADVDNMCGLLDNLFDLFNEYVLSIIYQEEIRLKKMAAAHPKAHEDLQSTSEHRLVTGNRKTSNKQLDPPPAFEVKYFSEDESKTSDSSEVTNTTVKFEQQTTKKCQQRVKYNQVQHSLEQFPQITTRNIVFLVEIKQGEAKGAIGNFWLRFNGQYLTKKLRIMFLDLSHDLHTKANESDKEDDYEVKLCVRTDGISDESDEVTNIRHQVHIIYSIKDNLGGILHDNTTMNKYTYPDDADEDPIAVRKIFSNLQVLTACFASFAHGGNDVSNAIGPLIALWIVYWSGGVSQASPTPWYLLLFGGGGISIGVWAFGRRVMETIGKDITKVTPSRGFCIELMTATTVLVASNVGIPISTTHCKVGAVVSIGWYGSRTAVDWSMARNIAFAWFVTVPVSGILSAGCMFLMMKL